MIAKPSIAFNDFSGTAKEVTARNVNGRNILSVRAKHTKVYTPAQAVSRNNLSSISRTYKQLTDSQMKAWEVLASHLKGIYSLGEAASLTAHNAFMRINSNRVKIGETILQDAPVFQGSIPAVTYEDFWITPEHIVFTGLEIPSDEYVLVFKMSGPQSAGVTSGYDKAIIISPDAIPDYGEVEVSVQYAKVFGFMPQYDKKYFCQFYWMEKATGFTGETTGVSAICKDGSEEHDTPFVPRAKVTRDMLDKGTQKIVPEFQLNITKGSTLVSIDAIITKYISAEGLTYTTGWDYTKFANGNGFTFIRGNADKNYHCSLALVCLEGSAGGLKVSIMNNLYSSESIYPANHFGTTAII